MPKSKPVNTSNVGLKTFDKELNTDVQGFHLPANSWSHARNATNSSETGDIGRLGNEPSNWQCGIDPQTGESKIPYMIIGIIHVTQDIWLVFSTDETVSEIGIFDESDCSYFTLVNDENAENCLNFSKHNLIIGVCRATSTCTYRAYWDDGRRNPSRTMEFSIDPLEANLYTNPNSPIPWVQTIGPQPCYDRENTDVIDCDKLRLEPYIQIPCVHISKAVSGGTLLNGSYMVSVAYAIEGQKISDWYTSNVQSIFEHQNSAGSIDVTLEGLDTSFNEIYVAIISIVNQQTVARLAGIYNTHQVHLNFDLIDNTWTTIPIEEIPIITPVMESSDGMFNVNNFLLRTGPISREDFNYQPLANQIVALWQAVRYPADYYVKGGNKTSYMRDEVYPFFIRWLYDTGDKTYSYHIPGRPPRDWEDNIASGSDSLPADGHYFDVYNTAIGLGSNVGTQTDDGGVIVNEGLMGYWESSEQYPTDKPEIWNAHTNPLAWNEDVNGNPIPYTGPFNTTQSHYSTHYGLGVGPDIGLDLCGRPIRHHKFPENCLREGKGDAGYTSGDGIVLMGVTFKNIKYPVSLDGTPIPGVVGYEILRGSRSGNKTVIAKGIINNMHEYEIPESNYTGLIPNYPYNDVNPDLFLVDGIVNFPVASKWNLWNNFKQNMFTFHSPETNITDPYLAAYEMKVYGEMHGRVTGKFSISEKHPQGKLLTDAAFWVSAIIGVGSGLMALHGKKNRKFGAESKIGSKLAAEAVTIGYDQEPNPVSQAAWAGFWGALRGTELTKDSTLGTTLLGSLFLPIGTAEGSSQSDLVQLSINAARVVMHAASSIAIPSDQGIEINESEFGRTPAIIRAVNQIPMFFSYWTQGSDAMFELLRALIQYRDFVLRYHSHCFYEDFVCARLEGGNMRRQVLTQGYIGPQITDFAGYKLNNLFRPRTVALEVKGDLPFAWDGQERTRLRVSDVKSPVAGEPPWTHPTSFSFDETSEYTLATQGLVGVPQRAASYYVGLKRHISNQYGQINGIKQLPASYCWFNAPEQDAESGNYIPTAVPVTSPIFGGDIYLNRYTEKNTFFFFYDWLYDQPDGAQLDYLKYRMIPYPRYWANFEKFQMNDFTSSINLDNIFNGGSAQAVFGNVVLPHTFYNLDESQAGALAGFTPNFLGIFTNFSSFWTMSKKNAWMYLFSSGVRDFYCESEYNIAQRDWGEQEWQQFYNPYGGTTDTESMFRTDLIKYGNFYKYDQSLSYGRLFLNYASWAHSQKINYNPYDAATCFTYYPKRLIYSLPIQDQMIKDAWSMFLPNNFKDFLSAITCVKPISKSGSIIFFNNLSPVMFQGVDELQTTGGTKLTIGDGGLFNQPMQNIVNADRSYEYGACQDRLSVINTPIGIFWINQNQGKIYNYAGRINEISGTDLRWWFSTYLPYKLTEDFPDFKVIDNPVSGIGCQAIYDNENGLLYFCKKDYKLKELPEDVKISYDHIAIDPRTGKEVVIPGSGTTFWLNDMTPFELGDEMSERYFEDASWTISYDPKLGSWISWHDWHPNLLMPSKNTFLSIVNRGIWVHNDNCMSYCNYYGTDFPFEVEYMVDTKAQVTSLRSLEYLLEVYKYADNCYDRFHVLDFNFDEAVVFNTEQVSGLLRLFLTPKNRPWYATEFPRVTGNTIDVLYDKVEQKYRINQFWDITADRGEYNQNAQRVIWNTQANGYVRILNPNNLNYNKSSLERKKFRHYVNSVLLRRRVSGDKKMLIILDTNKVLMSPR